MRRALLIATLASCAEHPAIERDVCGNQVLEAGEDCDTHADPALGEGTSCGAPEAAQACKYVCEPGALGPCPTGWVCLPNGTCAAHARSLGAPRFGATSVAKDLHASDVDGDGLTDLVGIALTRLEVLFGDPASPLAPQISRSVRVNRHPATVRDLDGDGTSDVALHANFSIDTLYAERDRSFASGLYGPVTDLVTGSARGAFPVPESLGRPVAIVGADFIRFADPIGTPPATAYGRGTGDLCAPAVSIRDRGEPNTPGRRDGRAPSYDVWVTRAGGLDVAKIAVRPGPMPNVAIFSRMESEVTPMGASAASPPFVGNIGGDAAYEDLVVLVRGPAGLALHVTLDLLGPAAPTSCLVRLPTLPLTQAQTRDALGLVAGDFNADGLLDIGLREGVLLSQRAPARCAEELDVEFQALQALGVTDAARGDLDGDGVDDLVIASVEEGVSLMRFGRNGRASRVAIDLPTPITTGTLVVADLDGDRVDDAAAVADKTLYVAFGDQETASFAATRVGRIAAMFFMPFYTGESLTEDGAADLLAFIEPDAQASLIFGSAERHLHAPIFPSNSAAQTQELLELVQTLPFPACDARPAGWASIGQVTELGSGSKSTRAIAIAVGAEGDGRKVDATNASVIEGAPPSIEQLACSTVRSTPDHVWSWGRDCATAEIHLTRVEHDASCTPRLVTTNLAFGGRAVALEIVELDGVGRSELVEVSSQGDETSLVLRATIDDRRAIHEIKRPGAAIDAAVAPIDRSRALVAFLADGVVYVERLSHAAGFESMGAYDARAVEPTRVRAGDFDGDGLTDVVALGEQAAMIFGGEREPSLGR